jgi:hypothetical protein
MRRLALAITLGCVLSGMVRAGEIPTTGAIASPTPSPATAPGEISSTGATTPGEIHSTEALTIILTLISIVP